MAMVSLGTGWMNFPQNSSSVETGPLDRSGSISRSHCACLNHSRRTCLTYDVPDSLTHQPCACLTHPSTMCLSHSPINHVPVSLTRSYILILSKEDHIWPSGLQTTWRTIRQRPVEAGRVPLKRAPCRRVPLTRRVRL